MSTVDPYANRRRWNPQTGQIEVNMGGPTHNCFAPPCPQPADNWTSEPKQPWEMSVDPKEHWKTITAVMDGAGYGPGGFQIPGGENHPGSFETMEIKPGWKPSPPRTLPWDGTPSPIQRLSGGTQVAGIFSPFNPKNWFGPNQSVGEQVQQGTYNPEEPAVSPMDTFLRGTSNRNKQLQELMNDPSW